MRKLARGVVLLAAVLAVGACACSPDGADYGRASCAAALAAQRGIDPRAIPIDDAKRQLKAIGAIVP